MDGGAAAIEVLVQNLINVAKDEISQIKSLEKDAEQLKMSLTMLQSYLNDAEKKFITHDAVKAWLKELEKVAFDADNVLDELKYHDLHKKVKTMKPMMDKALSSFSSFDHIVRPRKMALRIKEINASFESINKWATELHLQSIFVDAPTAVSVAAVETNSFSHDLIFVGRDDDVPKLVEVMSMSPEEKIYILAVVGMGGMGKTALTRKVFNHLKMRARFGFHSWVHVSHTFDPLIIFKKFLASLSSQIDEAESRGATSKMFQKSFKAKIDDVETTQVLLEKLEESLKDKTYLLVLDDVWNEDPSKWTYFIDSLTGVTSTKGNGIIITTRSEKVASIVNPLETHRLNALSDEDCWSIIKNMSIPSEFETIGRKIAKRCQGLPLAAKVVGGVLRHKSEQEWLSIAQKWLPDVEGNNIRGILRLSYDNLSSPELKKCFAYCSIFPRGHRMVKQELIELWMAEGFLQLGGRSDMESVGDMFVHVLLNNSLLQVLLKNDDEDKEIYVMHDLVHDLASWVLGSFKTRYMRHEDESSYISKESAKYLRTLFLEGEISEFKFSDFKCLHVLNFGSQSYLDRELEWSSIGKLIHLRKLDISQTMMEYLPDSIGELHHLQTLRADSWPLKKLPRTLKHLISLRHLYIRNRVKLPRKIGRLTSLQTLTHFTVGHENGCQIQELGSLKNLKGKLKIFNLEMVQGKEEAKKANISHNSNIVELTFDWDYNQEESENDEKLEIYGYQGKKFPLWTLKMAVRDAPQGCWVELNKLVEITLSRYEECEEIPTPGHLPNLKHLYLGGLSNVRSINSSFYRIDNIRVCQETFVVFPTLERLELDGMYSLKEWGEIGFHETRPQEVKVFSRVKELDIEGLQELECLPHWLFHDTHNLSRLMIKKCSKLRELPVFLQTLNSLEQLTIEHCPNLKSIRNSSFSGGQSHGALMSLTVLRIEKLEGLECLPDCIFHNHQNLSKLCISKCPQLRELPDGLHTLNSLEELRIESCPNLKSIGNPSGCKGRSHGTLRKLLIGDCKGLINLPHEMVESWAPSLDTLQLKSLCGLKNLPNVIEYLAKSDRLTILKIAGVPRFMVTRSVGSWPFRSLRILRMDASVEWSMESSDVIKETVDGILGACSHSLVELYLTGLDIWEYLPESIQYLTGVKMLELRNFGMEELPEWFGNLSSLWWLSLSGCTKLRRGGGSHALGRISKLETLLIEDCPKLRIDSKWCRNNIPNLHVKVDGHLIHSLSNLQKVHLMQRVTRCLKLAPKEDALKANVSENPNLREFEWYWVRGKRR